MVSGPALFSDDVSGHGFLQKFYPNRPSSRINLNF